MLTIVLNLAVALALLLTGCATKSQGAFQPGADFGLYGGAFGGDGAH